MILGRDSMCLFRSRSWPVIIDANDSVLLSTYDRADLSVRPSRILFGDQRGQWDYVMWMLLR